MVLLVFKVDLTFDDLLLCFKSVSLHISLLKLIIIKNNINKLYIIIYFLLFQLVFTYHMILLTILTIFTCEVLSLLLYDVFIGSIKMTPL